MTSRFQLTLKASAVLLLFGVGVSTMAAVVETSPAKRLTIKDAIFEVPVERQCNPGFVPGNDGIFRRVQYCHKANPSEPQGFLRLGFDVPASFLVGFTEADVVERWKSAEATQTRAVAPGLEFPSKVYAALNVQAAQAWERLLACAKGNADAARELYRTGSEPCDQALSIRSSVAEIRLSLRMLAASGEAVLYFDEALVERQITELQQKERRQQEELNTSSTVKLFREHQESLRQIVNWRDLQTMLRRSEYRRIMETYLTRMPRMHPLLMQVLVEESLSFLYPDEPLGRSPGKRTSEPERERHLLQLLLWMNSVENRGCSAFGLWPSANRAAIDVFVSSLRPSSGRKVESLIDELAGPRALYSGMLFVGCPMLHLGKELTGDESFELLMTPEANEVMRLSDIYLEGRLQAWRELLEVRSRYTRAVNH